MNLDLQDAIFASMEPGGATPAGKTGGKNEVEKERGKTKALLTDADKLIGKSKK